MFRKPSSTIYSDDSILDISTAPTTPDGSLTLSPVLHPFRLQDALEDATSKKLTEGRGRGSFDAMLTPPTGVVRNICCVGAGYVGTSKI